MANDNVENISESPHPTDEVKKCTNNRCGRTFSTAVKFKKCDRCCTIDRESKKRKKERNDEPVRAQAEKRPRRGEPEGGESDEDVFPTEVESEEGVETYSSHQNLFTALRAQARKCAVDKKQLEFKGKFTMPVNPLETERERVQLTCRDVWKATGFRFTVRDNPKLKNGHRTRYYCSQDESSKKAPKPSQNPKAKPRETPGMVRFPCRGRLSVSSRQKDESTRIIAINLSHTVHHVAYYDVSLPAEAADIIREHMEWCTPTELIKRVQTRFPSATANQIGDAWRSLSEMYWKRDAAQLLSASKLLTEFPDEVDVFQPRGVPEEVEILCWGMKKIAVRLTAARIVEIAIDATYNTNARQLELYGILAEYDNAGFPLAYCLLSTASSVAISKRKLALTAFGDCVRDTYGVNPEFAHTDKDMAEIGMLKAVWDLKISQCWWHVNDAVGKRIKSSKLSTTPYNSVRAHADFSFIDISFVPPSKADPNEYEGGNLAEESAPATVSEETPNPSRLTIHLPPSQLPPTSTAAPSATDTPRLDATGIPVLRIPPLRNVSSTGGDVEMSDAEDADSGKTRRTFCPAVYRDGIPALMKTHAFAHPLIPGYCFPSQEAIKYWAVKQMYSFCVEHDLREVWAYLWENWYRPGRWELWVRSVHPTIPRLRTTMICESHWRRIKHDFLNHFHSPRVDLLVWILVTKLAPTYYRKLDNLLIDTGRYRELMSWRKTFKSEWRKMEKREVDEAREVDVYRPDVVQWTCTCPSFLVHRFMICKHLIRKVHRVPARFFQQAERSRTTPFWSHPDLIPLSNDIEERPEQPEETSWSTEMAKTRDEETPDDEDDELIEEDEAWAARTATFDEELDGIINTLRGFTLGLEHQRKFKEWRMVEAVQRHGGGLLRLAEQCLEKDRRANVNRGEAPRTWESSSTMFYYPRPTGDRAT